MGHKETWGVMSMSIFFIMVVVSWMYKCVRTYQIMCFKYVQVIVCQFYINKAVFKGHRWYDNYQKKIKLVVRS